MKIINTILSIILLILSCMPCADTEMNSLAHTSDKFESNHNNHSHNKQNDLCPPFCNCACCGVQLANFEMQLVSFKENNIFAFQKEKISFYETIYIQKTVDKIWQPPKIS